MPDPAEEAKPAATEPEAAPVPKSKPAAKPAPAAEVVTPAPPITPDPISGDVAAVPAVESSPIPAALVSDPVESSAPVEPTEAVTPTKPSEAPVADVISEPAIEPAPEVVVDSTPAVEAPVVAEVPEAVPVAETSTEVDYVNPIDVEAEKIVLLVNLEKLKMTSVQVIEVLEDALPHMVSMVCLREKANAPEDFAKVLKEIDSANHHALRNTLSRKVRRYTLAIVNRAQSLLISDAIIAHALAAPVDAVAACYEAVHAGSFPEE